MTVREFLKKMTDEKEKLEAQISSLEEQERSATLDDDDSTYFSIGYELLDMEDYYKRLVIAIDIIDDFIKEI